jgi:hypothetical protein
MSEAGKPRSSGRGAVTDEVERIEPTPERRRHGKIEQAERAIISDDGEFTAPHIVVDILVELERRDAINADERLAGERFATWFRLAALDELRAADLSRPYVDGGGKISELSRRNYEARKEIDKAIRFVGGKGTRLGSCLWHVIGLDQSLTKWAENQSKTARVHRLSATGVLISALERLARMPWIGPFEKSP